MNRVAGLPSESGTGIKESYKQEVPTPNDPMTSGVAKANNESYPDIHP